MFWLVQLYVSRVLFVSNPRRQPNWHPTLSRVRGSHSAAERISAGCFWGEDQTQDPHVLRAIGRAWGWRRRMDTGEFSTIQELAEAVGLGERHVSRQLRLAYLAPEVLKRLTCGREASAVSLMALADITAKTWAEQEGSVFL